VALTARALGCSTFWYTGERDENMEQSIRDVAGRWGGTFNVVYKESVKSTISNFSGIKIHLTMYGEDHRRTVDTLQNVDLEPLLVIVGGAKVPRYVYSQVDFNLQQAFSSVPFWEMTICTPHMMMLQ
jgi:tRNA (cytidine56-2'-O)-methyltransferase